MSQKFQSYAKTGMGRITALPDNTEMDKFNIIKAGDFQPQDPIKGEIMIAIGEHPTQFTGVVLTVDNNGKIETFRTTSPNRIIPELSGEVCLAWFDYYRITSVDEN